MLYQLENVCLRRQKGDSVFELRIGNLGIRHNEFNFIVGESGCGKSTLMDGLGLLLPPLHAGTFLFRPSEQGRDYQLNAATEATRLRLRRSYLGFVLQSGGLISSLNVRENIILPAELGGLAVGNERINELAERLGIARCLKRKPGELSGGQRQRVAIARAVIHQPPLILADEPTAAVDHDRAHDICAIFRELSKDFGCTTLMVTHNRELADTFGDRILQLQPPVASEGVSISEVNW